MKAVFIWCCFTLVVFVTGQKLHNHETFQEHHQNILVIGETGSGKSTFIQYMLVNDLSKVNHEAIKASVHSVTKNTVAIKSPTMVINGDRFAATYYDTIGFNAEDIDSSKVFGDLNELVKFEQEIHKILIVHKVGRARKAMVSETERTIRLLRSLGATNENVYVTITFALGYNEKVRSHLKQEVEALYSSIVQPQNVFFSHYVLLSEVNPEMKEYYYNTMVKLHDTVLSKMREKVKPFRPMVATFKQFQNGTNYRAHLIGYYMYLDETNQYLQAQFPETPLPVIWAGILIGLTVLLKVLQA